MKTSSELSYGFRTPSDLVAKLERERALFSSPPDRDQIFNFMVTAHSLLDWTKKTYFEEVKVANFWTSKGKWTVPKRSATYIADTDDAGIVPNAPEAEILRYVLDSLSLCQHIANASKHYEWRKTVEGISDAPQISDFYQYFFTDVRDDIYVTIEQRHYGVRQIASITSQFYRGLLQDLEKIRQDS